MNYFYLFCASLLIVVPLKADPLIQHEPGVFFSETEQKYILNRLHLGEDLLVLCDGTCLYGRVLRLPDVHFSYGNFPLELHDVSAIAFVEKENCKKIQLITHDGYSFVFQSKKDVIPFVHTPSSSKIKIGSYKEIEVGEISYALLHRTSFSSSPKPSHLYCVELKDGAQFPVLFADETIHLNNGWYSFSVLSNRLLDVDVDGGLYGTILDQSGNKAPIEYVFLEDSHLQVKLLNSSSIVKIPWNQVQSIRKQRDPTNDMVEYVADKEHQYAVIPGIKIEQPSLRFRSESDHIDLEGLAWVEEPPLRFRSGSDHIELEGLAWVDDEPPVRFRSGSDHIDLEGLAWVEEPPLRFRSESDHVELEGLAWVDDSIQLPFDETKQLALVQESNNHHQNWKVLERGYKESILKIKEENKQLKQEINGLQQLNVQLRSQIKRAEDSHDDLVVAKYEMENKITQLLEQISMSKDQIENLNENLLKSNSMLLSKDQLYEELSNALKTMESEKKSLFANRQILDDKVNQLQSKLSQQKNEQETFLQLVEKKRKEIELSEDEHARQLEILASEIQSLCHELSVGEQEKMMLIEQTVQLTNQLSESHQSLEVVKKQIVEKDNLVTTLRKEIHEIEINLEDAIKGKERLAKNLKEIEAQNQQFLTNNTELKALLDASHMDIKKFNELSQRSKDQLSEKDTQLEQVQKSYYEAQRREEETINALAKAHNEGEQALVQISQLNEQLVKEKKLSSEYKRKMDQLFPQYDMEKLKGLQLQQQVSHFQQRVKEFEDALKVAETRLLASRERYSHLAENNQRLLQENELLTNQLRQVQVRLQEHRDLASKLNESINAVNRDVDNSHQYRNYQSQESKLSQPDKYHRNPESNQANYSSTTSSRLLSFKEIHVVADGENLNNISMKYYNTPNRWEDIYEANQDVISDVDHLKVGASLVIPE